MSTDHTREAPVASLRACMRIAALTAALAFLSLGCNAEYMKADIKPTQGNTVKGEVRFYKVADGVRIVARLEGLSPGRHGFHVHEKGDCSAPDASSAGGHFNPSGAPH